MSSFKTALMYLTLVLMLIPASADFLILVGIDPHGALSWAFRPWPVWLIWVLALVAISGLAILGWQKLRRTLKAAAAAAELAREQAVKVNAAAAAQVRAAAELARKEGAAAQAHEQARKDRVKALEEVQEAKFLNDRKALHNTLHRLNWLYYDWQPQYRYGQTDALDDERAFQLVEQLVELKVLEPSDRHYDLKQDGFRNRLARIIAKLESEMDLPPPGRAPL